MTDYAIDHVAHWAEIERNEDTTFTFRPTPGQVRVLLDAREPLDRHSTGGHSTGPNRPRDLPRVGMDPRLPIGAADATPSLGPTEQLNRPEFCGDSVAWNHAAAVVSRC